MPSRSNGLAAEMEAVRTLALVGPAAAGKSSLAEALLHKAGAIGACGSIERGSTVSDHDPLERRMLHSLNASVMHLKHAGTRIHLIDTPGGPDFLGQSLPALEAVETAAVVINAATGIEPMAVRMMEYAASRHLARMIIVNKIDSQGVSLQGLLADIQAAFGRECLPLNLPDGVNRQVVDCFFNRFGRSDFGPVEAAHRALVEQVVEVDAAFVDRYLEEGDVDPAELHAPLEQALREGHLIPVCFVSSRSGAGVAELLDVIVKLLPDPTEGNPPEFLLGEGAEARPMEVRPDPSLHVLAHVFKVTVDPYVGKMGIFRVHQGTLTRDSQLYIGDGRKPFKVGHLFMLQGKDHVEVSHAVPGDIVAVAKVDEIHFDAVLHDAAEDSHVHLAPLAFPVPVHGLAVEPKRHGDEQRAWEILGKLAAEDPCLRIEHVAATNETVLYGLGRASPAHRARALARGVPLRGVDAAAAHCLPRNRDRAGRGPPPPQEADRRRWPVRRGLPAHRAAAARCRLSSLPTRCAAARFRASSFPRWRRACARCWQAAPSPATRWSTCAWWCTTASTTASTARTSPLRPPAARPSWPRSARPGPWCSSRSCR